MKFVLILLLALARVSFALTRLLDRQYIEPLLTHTDAAQLQNITDLMHLIAQSHNISLNEPAQPESNPSKPHLSSAHPLLTLTSDELWEYFFAIADGLDLLAEAEQLTECVETTDQTVRDLATTWRLFYANF